MRIRRKKWARPELQDCRYYISNPTEYFGCWNKQFKNNNPIHLELGCGKGVFISKLAVKNQNINYIAVDIKTDILAVAKRNIEKTFFSFKNNSDIENVLLAEFNVQQISDVFSIRDEIDRIYINFCNPWNKEKHKKRRLTHIRQLENYKNFLKNNSEIFFKTDDDELYRDSLTYFIDTGFKIELNVEKITNQNEQFSLPQSEHETMYIEQKKNIYMIIAKTP